MDALSSTHLRMSQDNRSRRIRLLVALSVVVLSGLLLLAPAASPAAASPVPGDRFLSPLDGQIVDGEMAVTVYAPSSTESAVLLGIDGLGWQLMEQTGYDIYTAKWDTTSVANGEHRLTAHFLSRRLDQPGYSISITVEVRNPQIAAQDDRPASLADFADATQPPRLCFLPPVGLKESYCIQQPIPKQ